MDNSDKILEAEVHRKVIPAQRILPRSVGPA